MNVTENEWRKGTALRPYFDDVKRIVSERELYMPEHTKAGKGTFIEYKYPKFRRHIN